MKLEAIFDKQFEFAWNHFEFHAEQRIRMFHFFIITSALILNAFSFLVGSEDPSFHSYAFIMLCVGGLISTMFLSLDVRNSQLLSMSEALLRKIEEETLYPDPEWRECKAGKQIKLGILLREGVVDDYMEKTRPDLNRSWRGWLELNKIKHTFSIRFIEMIAIVCFWIFGILATPPDLWWARIFEFFVFVVCVRWVVDAMRTPERHRAREPEALFWWARRTARP